MGVKSFFEKMFNIGPGDTSSPKETQVKFLNGTPVEYSRYTGEVYANHLVRGIVHKIASYCSLISFDHCRGWGSTFERVNDDLSRLLTFKPNDFMTPSELKYKFFTDLFVTNNAYLWIKRNKETGRATAILPIIADRVEMKEIDGFLFYKFHFSNGEKITIYSGDVLHRRRFYYQNDWFGGDNEPLRDAVGLVNTMQTSVDAALKNGAQIKGILQHQNTIDPDDLKKHEQMFKESYLRASNSGGVGVIDAKFNFIPIQYSGKIVDAEQMKEIRDYVYRYYNMNDDIMMSQYNSEKWQSFHEGTIAPELNGTTEAMRILLFTDREIGLGHRIITSVNSITFMSPQQRIAMVKLALDGALYNRNEIREWFGDAPIPGGDIYQYSKNFTENTQTGNQDKEETNGEATEADVADGVPKSNEET